MRKIDLSSHFISHLRYVSKINPPMPFSCFCNINIKRVRAKAMASTMMKSGSMEVDLASPLLTIKKVEVVELFSFCFIPCVPY